MATLVAEGVLKEGSKNRDNQHHTAGRIVHEVGLMMFISMVFDQAVRRGFDAAKVAQAPPDPEPLSWEQPHAHARGVPPAEEPVWATIPGCTVPLVGAEEPSPGTAVDRAKEYKELMEKGGAEITEEERADWRMRSSSEEQYTIRSASSLQPPGDGRDEPAAAGDWTPANGEADAGAVLAVLMPNGMLCDACSIAAHAAESTGDCDLKEDCPDCANCYRIVQVVSVDAPMAEDDDADPDPVHTVAVVDGRSYCTPFSLYAESVDAVIYAPSGRNLGRTWNELSDTQRQQFRARYERARVANSELETRELDLSEEQYVYLGVALTEAQVDGILAEVGSDLDRRHGAIDQDIDSLRGDAIGCDGCSFFDNTSLLAVVEYAMGKYDDELEEFQKTSFVKRAAFAW